MKIIGANITGSFILNSQDVTTTLQSSSIWSGSVASSITALNASTASLNAATASLLNYTASTTTAIADILLETASFNAFSSSILNYTASTTTAIADILLETASINLLTASLLSYTSSQNNRNGTFATTGSNTFTGVQTVNSNLIVTGSITAQTLIVQTITSSQDFVTGSTKFGSLAINTHQFTGSVIVTGSLNATAFTGSGAGLTSIPNAALTNSTISGIALGSNLATLTIGTGLSGTSYNGSGAVTIANTGVTSNVAGTGITVSGATGAVTITNSGVTSIVAGTNISISGATGAVTITNGVTNNNQLTNGAGYITSAGTSADSNLLNGISAVNLYNNMGAAHGIRSSFDASSPSYGFGYRYVQGSTNGPGTGGSQFYSWYIGLGSDYPATGGGSYGAMFAVDRNIAGPYLSVRYNENNSFSSWRKIYAGYADSTALTNAPTYNQPAVRVTSSGTTSAGASFAIQQITGEGWTGIFVDYEPYTGWGLYHDNPNNYFCVTAESSTGQLRSFTVPSRESGNRTAYEKIRFDQGTGAILAGGDITAFSDGRVKAEVKVIDKALEKVLAIRGVTFVRTDAEGEDKNKRHAGVIAQEVLEVLPEVVNMDKNTGMYNVAYGNMNALLVEAIKEQQTQIEELKTIINGLTK